MFGEVSALKADLQDQKEVFRALEMRLAFILSFCAFAFAETFALGLAVTLATGFFTGLRSKMSPILGAKR